MGLDDRIVSRYINDFSGLLDLKSETLIKIEELFFYHYEACGEQIITIIIPCLEGKSLKEIGMEFFKKNGFGDKEKNSGLLLIVAQKEKKLRIITGKGLKRKYPISVLRSIVENKLRGPVNIGDYERLLELWLKVTTDDNERKSGINLSLGIGIVLLLIVIAFLLLFFVLHFFSGAVTIFCVIYYYDILLFLTACIGCIALIYTLYLYFKNIKSRGRYTHVMLWIFITMLLSLFFRYGMVEINGSSLLNQPDKKNKPEWCEISRGGKEVNQASMYRNDINDNRSDSYNNSKVEFGGGGSTDGHSYGD